MRDEGQLQAMAAVHESLLTQRRHPSLLSRCPLLLLGVKRISRREVLVDAAPAGQEAVASATAVAAVSAPACR
jgi:hypothetical protein